MPKLFVAPHLRIPNTWISIFHFPHYLCQLLRCKLPNIHPACIGTSGSTMTIGGLLPGIYTVTVTDANGCSTTATAEVELVSSSTEIADLKVQVWPNPMRERLELYVPGLPTGAYRFVLRDALGKALAGVDVLGGRAVLDVRDLVPGVYSWSLEGKNGVLARGKVVK